MKNALNNQVGMLGDMFLWLVANLKQGVIYFIKQGAGIIKLHECNWSNVDDVRAKTSQRKRQRKSTVCT